MRNNKPHCFNTILLLFASLLYMSLSSCKSSMTLKKTINQQLVNDSIIKTGHVGFCLYDPQTQQYLIDYNAAKNFIPASNTKLFTLYAGMKYLGDSLTGAFYKYSNDTLLILPSGDPTLYSKDFNKHPVAEFIKNNKKKLVLLEPESKFKNYGKGWAWDDQQESYMAQRSLMPVFENKIRIEWIKNNANTNGFQYDVSSMNTEPPLFSIEKNTDTSAKEHSIFRKANSNHYTITANNKTQVFTTEAPVETYGIDAAFKLIQTISNQQLFVRKTSQGNLQQFKRIFSQSSDSLFKIMMHRSDNFYAEQVLLMAGNEKIGAFDDEKTISTLLQEDFSDIPQKPKWVDGSGLSRYNLFSPKDMVYIIDKLMTTFGSARIENILPTGGEGTLKNMLVADSGFVFAKTGSLGNTYCLTGILKTLKGKQLYFSCMINNYTGNVADVKKSIVKVIHTIRTEN